MTPTDPKKPIDIVSRGPVIVYSPQRPAHELRRNVVACPQCGFELENRCMARCVNCGFYCPCGSEPDGP